MNHRHFAQLLTAIRARIVLASLGPRLGQHLPDLLMVIGTRPGPVKIVLLTCALKNALAIIHPLPCPLGPRVAASLMMGRRVADGGVDAEKPIFISSVVFFCNIPISTIPIGVVSFVHINPPTLHDLVLGAELLVEGSSSKPSRLQCSGSLRASPV